MLRFDRADFLQTLGKRRKFSGRDIAAGSFVMDQRLDLLVGFGFAFLSHFQASAFS
jgi:hypothetical protein